MGILSELTGSGQRRRTRSASHQAIEDVTQGSTEAAGYLDPYATAGQDVLQRLLQGTQQGGEFYGQPQVDVLQDPSYEFRLQQGLAGVERSGAARGLALSGQTLRGLNDYAQNFASQEYGAAYDRAQQQRQQTLGILASLFGAGTQASGNLASLREALGTNLANIRTGSAAAQNAASGPFNEAVLGAVGGAGQAGLDYYLKPPA